MTKLNKTQSTEIIDIDTLKKDIIRIVSFLGEAEDYEEVDEIDGFTIPHIEVESNDKMEYRVSVDEPTLSYINDYMDFTFYLNDDSLSVSLILGARCAKPDEANEFMDSVTERFPFEVCVVPNEGDSLYFDCYLKYSNYTDLVEKLQKAIASFYDPKYVEYLTHLLTYYN